MPEKDNLENPLAILGDEDVVLGFSALGFKTYALKEKQEFSLILEEIVRKNTAVCLIQENIFSVQKDSIEAYRNLPLPIFIPFAKSDKSILLNNIVKGIRLRATGTF